MAGLDPNLVGLGSYLANAVGYCNGCHTGGGPPNFDYAAGGNPLSEFMQIIRNGTDYDHVHPTWTATSPVRKRE